MPVLRRAIDGEKPSRPPRQGDPTGIGWLAAWTGPLVAGKIRFRYGSKELSNLSHISPRRMVQFTKQDGFLHVLFTSPYWGRGVY